MGDPTPSLDEFSRQTSLMTSCTLLWKELSDHFSSLEQDLINKSESLKRKLQAFNDDTKNSLTKLDKRDSTLSHSMSMILQKLESNTQQGIHQITTSNNNIINNNNNNDVVSESDSLVEILSGFCVRMGVREFWSFMISRKKELDSFRDVLPKALNKCVDPPRFVLEAISEVFPVDKRTGKDDEKCDLGWACVVLLESLIPVMMDPVLGKDRMIVTPRIKGKAEDIAETWKKSLEDRGGIENVKTPDVHTFLQHLVTFGIVNKYDVNLYMELVVASAWRKQMPKLAVSLGLKDKMPDMIEELIGRGQQVDAVHFTYEVGLAEKYPPVPLLRAFLKDAKKAATSLMEDPNNSGRAAHLAAKKEQSAIRAVLKCIEEYKLETEFPPEDLKKRLDQLDKVKIERKKPAQSPATKRTRASNVGPMPPAKAGRSTNAYVSSFPSPPTYMRSPSHVQYPAPVPAYPASPVLYGNRSPSYAYSPEAPPQLVGSYAVSPVNFAPYGGYSHGMGPAYQQAYY